MMDKAAAALFSVYRLFAVLPVLCWPLFSDSSEETDGWGGRCINGRAASGAAPQILC